MLQGEQCSIQAGSFNSMVSGQHVQWHVTRPNSAHKDLQGMQLVTMTSEPGGKVASVRVDDVGRWCSGEF